MQSGDFLSHRPGEKRRSQIKKSHKLNKGNSHKFLLLFKSSLSLLVCLDGALIFFAAFASCGVDVMMPAPQLYHDDVGNLSKIM